MVTKVAMPVLERLHPVTNLLYERPAWQQKQVVCGVDEVGRGCLAGPVVAAAVIFPVGSVIRGIKDSKKITKLALPKLAKEIKNSAWWAIGIGDHFLIDSCNIRRATQLAMCRAVHNLLSICPLYPSKLLIDAMPLDGYIDNSFECISAPRGEDWSYSIAAASIVAKVARDQLMREYASIFPDFGLEKHKGYGTKVHTQALLVQGESVIHRNSFLTKLKQGDLQRSLF